jgi:hypothetical protein
MRTALNFMTTFHDILDDLFNADNVFVIYHRNTKTTDKNDTGLDGEMFFTCSWYFTAVQVVSA